MDEHCEYRTLTKINHGWFFRCEKEESPLSPCKGNNCDMYKLAKGKVYCPNCKYFEENNPTHLLDSQYHCGYSKKRNEPYIMFLLEKKCGNYKVKEKK